MVNNDRIVPVQKVDFLSLVGIILKIANVDATVIESDGVGNFEADAGVKLANQSIKSLNFTATSGTVYGVLSYDFEGISVAGAAQELENLKADGITLYKFTLSSGAVAVQVITPEV